MSFIKTKNKFGLKLSLKVKFVLSKFVLFFEITPKNLQTYTSNTKIFSISIKRYVSTCVDNEWQMKLM